MLLLVPRENLEMIDTPYACAIDLVTILDLVTVLSMTNFLFSKMHRFGDNFANFSILI